MSDDRRAALLAARANRPTPPPSVEAAAPPAAAAPAKMTLPPNDARSPVPPEGRVVFRKDDFEVKQVPKGTKAPPGGFKGPDGRSAPGGPTIVGGPGAKNRNRPDAAKFVTTSHRGNPNVKTVGGRQSNFQVVDRIQTKSQSGVVATAAVPRNVELPVARGPAVDLTVVLSYHARPDVIEPQQRLLVAQSITPRAVVAWINPHENRIAPHVLQTLMRMPCVQPNIDMGPWMRWGVASQAQTEFVAIFDDDAMPGPRWLEAAIARLLASNNEHDVVAAAGLLYSSDQSADARAVGPERPPTEEVDVDVGRGAWVMRTATARLIASQQRPIDLLSTGLHVAAVVQEQDALTVVLPYGRDHATWGMLEPPRQDGSVGQRVDQEFELQQAPHSAAELREIVFRAYREEGWMPWCVVLADSASDMDTVELEADSAG